MAFSRITSKSSKSENIHQKPGNDKPEGENEPVSKATTNTLWRTIATGASLPGNQSDAKPEPKSASGEVAQRLCQGCEEEQGEESQPDIQPKLTIGAVDDPLEDEADRIADQVTSMSAPSKRPEDDQPVEAPEPSARLSRMFQRQPASPGVVEELVQRRASDDEADASSQVASGVQRLQGRGEPLNDSSRAYFEPRFGADLSDVRIHTDSQASGLADDINAKAFTAGTNIVFNKGQYDPGSAAGQKLLAHELTHTLQQGAVQPSARLLRRSGPVGSATSVQRAPDDEKTYIIKRVTLNSDPFHVRLKHVPVDGAVDIRVTYQGSHDYIPRSTDFSVLDKDLTSAADNHSYRLEENTAPKAPNPSHRIVWDPYQSRPGITIQIHDSVFVNDKWVPPRRKHSFTGTVSGTFRLSRRVNEIEVIPHNAIPATVTEPAYQEIEVPTVPELSANQALLAAKSAVMEISENEKLYKLQWKPVLDKLQVELDDKIKALDPSKDNKEEARWATSLIRGADYFKQKAPSLTIFLIPGLFPENITKEATALVREVHQDYEMGLYMSGVSLDKANTYFKRADYNLRRLQFRLTNLYLKHKSGGLDALANELVSLSTDIHNFRSLAGVSQKFSYLEEKVLGIRQTSVGPNQFVAGTPTTATAIRSSIGALRSAHSKAELDVFHRVMQLASLARAYKGIFSMVATYELLRFYRKGYYGAASWTIDAVLPGSGQKKVDGYIDSIGGLLSELQNEFKQNQGVSETFLTDILSRFRDIAGNEAFEKDLKFIVERLNSIGKVKAVIKGLLVIIAAAIGAAIIGPAAGAIAAELGVGATGVGLITFGAEVLAFTAISRLGNELMFGKNEMGFIEDLMHNAVMFGVLKGVARVHRLAFTKVASPKLYPKLFTATGSTLTFISLYGLGMVQHALPPSLGGKGRRATLEEQGWMLVQNIALMAAMSLAGRITKPIRQELDARTFDALTSHHKRRLADLEINRQGLKDEVAAVRKLGLNADPVRRQRLINNIERQFNSDIAWLKEAIRIVQRHPAVVGVDKGKLKQFIAEYRSHIDRLKVSLAEQGYEFNPGGEQIVKYVEPGVLAYTSEAFKTATTDPLTGEKRTIKDLGGGNYEVQVGGRRLLYVPESKLPVELADPKGVRALVEYYQFNWDTAKKAFGSDGSKTMNYLLLRAWQTGWRPGQDIPSDIQRQIFEHFGKRFDRELRGFSQDIRNLPDRLPTQEKDRPGGLVLRGGLSPFSVPGGVTKSGYLTIDNISRERLRIKAELETMLEKLDPGIRHALVSYYVTRATNLMLTERAGTKDITDYPPIDEIIKVGPIIEKGGLHVFQGLVDVFMTDREMLWMLFEFRDNPGTLLEHYKTYMSAPRKQSFREYGRRYLFTDEFNRALDKLNDYKAAKREAERAARMAASSQDTRSLQDRFGAEWKTGVTEADLAHNNALLYRDSEPGIIEAYHRGELPIHIQTAIADTLKGDHLTSYNAGGAGTYRKARTKVVGLINEAIERQIRSFADYRQLIDLSTQSATIGRFGEAFTRAMETTVGLPGGGRKVTVHLDAKTMTALNKARQADGKEPVFDPAKDQWITLDLFYADGNLIAEIKVGSSYSPTQFSRYATLALYQKYIKASLKAAGIDRVDGLFYLALPSAKGSTAGASGVPEQQARRIHKDAVSEGVETLTQIRFINRDGKLYELIDSTTTKLVKTVK